MSADIVPAAVDPIQARLADYRYRGGRLWAGESGEPVTGQAVASHLAAVKELLADEGWTRQPGSPNGYSLGGAMWRVGQGPVSDMDTYRVAGRCLELLLEVLTGASTVCYDAWSGRRERTRGDIDRLLQAGAEFARQYGPVA